MLEPLPSRSVTRFMLPLADVMTLLFAIFLLMPLLQQQPGQQPAQALTPGSYWSPDEQRNAREELSRLRRLAQLPANQRLHLVVLNIDGKTGHLLFQDGTTEVTLSDPQTADDIIRKHVDAARAGSKELFYVLQLPRPGQPHIHPDGLDQDNYRQWFGKHAVNYEIAGLRGKR